MFSGDIQKQLKKNGFELTCNEENIWVKEVGEQSVTISGDDTCVEAIWQTFEGDFEEITALNIDEALQWAENMFGE